MRRDHYAEDRWIFIESIQIWFQHKNQFWLLISILSFSVVVVLQIFLSFASEANPSARQQSEFLVAPILAIFTLSTFWRSVVHTFLSFTGALITYGGMFLFHVTSVTAQLVTPYTANRLGFGIKHLVIISPNAIADRYFIVGMFALVFCLVIAIKPKFFKSKDPDDLPFPVWRHSKKFVLTQKSGLIKFVPVSAFLTYEEQHFIAKYKYIVLIISGTKFLVTPYDWVPDDSVVIRDAKSNSIIGIL